MAGNSVNYIIKLLADDSDLKKQLQSAEKEVTKLNAHERAEIKATLQARMDALAAQGKAAKKNPGNTTMVAGMEDELKFMREVFAEMKALNPAEDWAKSGKMFAQTFSDMHKQLSELATIITPLKDSIAELGTSFGELGFNITPTINVSDVTKQATKAMDGVGDVIATRVHGISKEVQKAYNKANATLASLSTNKSSSYGIEDQRHLQSMLNALRKSYKDSLADSQYAETAVQEQKALIEAAKYAKEYLDLVQWAEKSAKDPKSNIVSDFVSVDENEMERMRHTIDSQISYARQQIERYNEEVQKVHELNLADRITKNLKNLNIRLDLEPKSQFTKKVNDYIDSINTKKLHTIKVNIDDAFDLNKKKRKKKGESEQEVDEVISKSGLENFETAIDKMQGSVKNKTNVWRTEMLKLLKFGKGDFQFNFGNALMDDLQQFFYEPGHELDIIINEEELKRRIQNVVQESGGVIGSTGGTATFDPKMMASAVYSAIQAAFTGKEMPTFDFGDTTVATEEVSDATDEATESNKKYVKTLDESTIHIDKVVESLKKFAQIAPKSKAGRAVDTWFSDRGIDMPLIRAGISDSEIISMLQETWMSEDKMGHAQGATVVDEIAKFFAKYKSLKPDTGAGKALTVLEGDIKELFK